MFRLAPFVCLLLSLSPSAPFLIAQNQPPGPSSSSQVPKGDWASYDRDYIGDRYSPLDEIKTDNVTHLQEICTYDSGIKTSFETGPVVVGGTLYFTTLDTTFAIDPEICKLRWKHTEPLTEAERLGLGVNRGVAFADGKIFRGYDDGNVVAIDAKSGKAVWSTTIARKDKGETIPAAPVAWKSMVFIGNAGGDNFAVTGKIYALEANTGKQRWHFDVVPQGGPAADSARSPEPSSVQAANVTSCLAAHNGMVRRITCWIPVCRSCRAVWSTSTTTPCWTNSMARVADTEELSARLSSSSQRLVSRLVEISNRRRNARTSLAVAMRPATARRSSHSLAGVVSERTWSISPRSTAAASCIGSSSRCGNSCSPSQRSHWASGRAAPTRSSHL